MRYLLFLILILTSTLTYATHTYGGYINYTHVSNRTYEITITLIQDAFSPAITRDEIEINYGDNSVPDTITRSSIIQLPNSNFNLTKSEYITQHTFNGAGIFRITVEDPNRASNILNLPNSVTIPIFLETSIQITPSSDVQNNSPTINSNMVVYSQSNKDFRFNLAANDKDGDFLTYQLVKSKGSNGIGANGYSIPDGCSIDLINGEFRWDSPSSPSVEGFYQFTVEITECRNDRLISKTNVDYAIYNSASNHYSAFYNANLLDTNLLGNISYTITPGDSVSFNIDFQSNDTFVLRLIDETNRAIYSTNGDFKFVSALDDNRCSPYLFVFESDTRGVLEHETVMIRVIDTNLINCDTICGFDLLSLSKKMIIPNRELVSSPNPFINQTTVELPNMLNTIEFKLYNNIGQLVEVNYEVTENRIVLHRSGLKKGVYFFRVFGKNKEQYFGKLVAQ